jgi:DNA-binding NarL/FixJ family response regulator
MSVNKSTIVIADDHALIRLGLGNIIHKIKNYDLVAEFDNGKDALDYILNNEPDIAILDIEMPGLNGIEVCRQVKEEKLSTKILFLTMLNQESVFKKAHQIGANGFLLKSFALDELESALKKINEGEFYVSANIEQRLVNVPSRLLDNEDIKQKLKTLTTTENKVLKLIALNLNSKQIAEKFFTSELTVRWHRKNITRKLELDNEQNSLLKFATKNIDYLK